MGGDSSGGCVCMLKILILRMQVLPLPFKNIPTALASVAQWIERQPVNQRDTGSIASQDILPGLQARFSVRGAQRQPLIDVSLPPFPSL